VGNDLVQVVPESGVVTIRAEVVDTAVGELPAKL
jgi:hypothetical protein